MHQLESFSFSALCGRRWSKCSANSAWFLFSELFRATIRQTDKTVWHTLLISWSEVFARTLQHILHTTASYALSGPLESSKTGLFLPLHVLHSINCLFLSLFLLVTFFPSLTFTCRGKKSSSDGQRHRQHRLQPLLLLLALRVWFPIKCSLARSSYLWSSRALSLQFPSLTLSMERHTH